MTKYVLNSGNVRSDTKKAKKYIAEVLKNLGNNPKILLCFFANLREDWEEKFANYSKDIVRLAPKGVLPTFEMALPNEFEKQVKKADVVYVHGGDDYLVQYWLKQFDLPRIWDGKVVAVSSASADAVCNSFWTGDWRKCMDGLDLVPIKFIPHFRSEYGKSDPRGPIDWDHIYKELLEYGNKTLPIYALEEGDFVIFER